MRIIITGGGTGGHIYPALALARYLQKEDPAAELLFVGSERGLEQKIADKLVHLRDLDAKARRDAKE